MKTEFSRDAYHAYMILEPAGGQAGSFEEQMLANQDSGYLLRFHPQEIDSVKKYYYEITGMMDFVSCVNRREVSFAMLQGMLRSLSGCCDVMNEYLLQPDSLLLIPDRIYMDIDMTSMHFAYVPGYQGDFLEGLRSLSESLLAAADHKDRECVMLVYAFYKIVREDDFSALSIRKLLGEEVKASSRQEKAVPPDKSISSTGEQKVCTEEEEDRAFLSGKDIEESRSEEKKIPDLRMIGLYGAGGLICLAAACVYRFGWLQGVAEQIGIGEKYILAGILFGAAALLLLLMKIMRLHNEASGEEKKEKHVFSDEDFWQESDYPGGHYEFTDWSDYDSDQTVVLSAGKGARLISMNKNIAEDVLVTSLPAILGSRIPEAQILLPYSGISRKHAFLEEEGGRFYLTDLGSTNGTWLNGERLRQDEKKVLVQEDLIVFADITFMFMAAGPAGGGT